MATAPARAQTALCPATVNGQTGFALSNGTCTNGTTGAFSGAALATQALSDLSQSATQETVRNTNSALATRREAEQERCPDGFARVNGICEPLVQPVRPAPVAATPSRTRVRVKAATPEAGLSRRRVVTRRAAPEPAPIVPVYSPIPIYQSRFGAWAQGFGNTEDRSAVGASSINCCTAVAALGGAGIPIALGITEKSSADTFGFLGGIDYTTRGLTRPDDGLIFGVLAGYIESDFHVRTSATSGLITNVGNGSGVVNADLTGGSAGFYATYFAGAFTADLTFKADLFDIDESFTDQLAFTANVGVPASVNAFSGRGSGGLTNLSTFGNLSYRLFTFGPVWVEPTVGFQYTDSLYDGRARRELGLDDGDLVEVQGGARVGIDTILANRSRMTTSLTGLAYSDVSVNGGVIQGGLFGTNLLARSDEGKVRGRGILTVNYEIGNGTSIFAQGDVYGGDRLFGAGGKGGFRVQW